MDYQEEIVEGYDGMRRHTFVCPLARGVDKRSNGKVEKWFRSWWNDLEGEKPWGNMALIEASSIKDNLFDLYKVKGPRLWMPPCSNEDNHGGVQQGKNSPPKTSPYICGS